MTTAIHNVHTLQDLLAPMAPPAFMAQYRQRHPLHLPPTAATPVERFGRLLPLDELDRVFASAAGYPGDWEFFGPGGRIDPREFTDVSGQMQMNRLAALYAEGGNIYLSQLQHYAATLTPLWRELTHALRTDVAMNLWVTRGDAAAPYLHCDDHELFILQLQGRQEWAVFNAAAPGYVPATQSGHFDRAEHGDPLLQATLEPGALLYLPAGLPCEVLPSDDFSMHIAISVFPVRWCDVLSATLAELDLHGNALDGVVPPALAGDGAALRQRLAVQVHSALQQFDPAALAYRLESLYVAALPPPQDGHFRRELLADETLLPHSRVRRRDGAACVLYTRPRDDTASISFPGGGGLAGPGALAPLLHFVAHAEGAFSADDLPGDFDPASGALLLHRLLRMGLLERCD